MPAQRSMWKRSTPPARPPEPNSDAPTLAESGPISPSPGRAHVSQTRTGATWVGIVIGVLVLVLLICLSPTEHRLGPRGVPRPAGGGAARRDAAHRGRRIRHRDVGRGEPADGAIAAPDQQRRIGQHDQVTPPRRCLPGRPTQRDHWTATLSHDTDGQPAPQPHVNQNGNTHHVHIPV